jgi:hypothetical protein
MGPLIGLLSVVSFAYTTWFSIWFAGFIERVMDVVESGQMEELALIESAPGGWLAHALASVIILGLVVIFLRDIARRFPGQTARRIFWFAGIVLLGPFLFPIYFLLFYRTPLPAPSQV